MHLQARRFVYFLKTGNRCLCLKASRQIWVIQSWCFFYNGLSFLIVKTLVFSSHLWSQTRNLQWRWQWRIFAITLSDSLTLSDSVNFFLVNMVFWFWLDPQKVPHHLHLACQRNCRTMLVALVTDQLLSVQVIRRENITVQGDSIKAGRLLNSLLCHDEWGGVFT